MKLPRIEASMLLLAFLSALSSSSAAAWPRFRGENGAGISEAHSFPPMIPKEMRAWETPSPLGSSSPIITSNRVIITGYRPQERMAWCLDLATGAKLWERQIAAARSERKSAPNDPASSTPATDGTNVFVLFSGFGLLAFDFDGKEKWRTPLEP